MAKGFKTFEQGYKRSEEIYGEIRKVHTDAITDYVEQFDEQIRNKLFSNGANLEYTEGRRFFYKEKLLTRLLNQNDT